MSSGSHLYLGLDVGGTFLKGALVDAEGRIRSRLREPVAKDSLDALLGQLARAVEALEAGGARVEAVGLGVPGIVERNSRVRIVPAIPALEGVAVADELLRRTGRHAFLENDANAAALAEAWVGGGRGEACMLFVTLGTGVGAGLVLEGRIWAGHSGYAGELGHVHVDPAGAPCGCGSWGCVETVAGARGWRRIAGDLLASRESALRERELDPRTIVEAALEGDAVALEVLDAVAGALGAGIAAVLQLLNVERVVIGGGVSSAGPVLLDRIAEQTRRRTFPHVFADCSFRAAELGPDAGVVGAARVGMRGVGAP